MQYAKHTERGARSNSRAEASDMQPGQLLHEAAVNWYVDSMTAAYFFVLKK